MNKIWGGLISDMKKVLGNDDTRVRWTERFSITSLFIIF